MPAVRHSRAVHIAALQSSMAADWQEDIGTVKLSYGHHALLDHTKGCLQYNKCKVKLPNAQMMCRPTWNIIST